MAEALELFEDGFSYKGQKYSYDEVTHLARVASRNVVGVGLIPVAAFDNLRIGIYVGDREKPIKLKNTVRFIGMTRKLSETYRFLATATFRSRLMPYLEEYERNGYFTYSQLKFTNAAEVVGDKRTVDLCTCVSTYQPFEACFSPPKLLARSLKAYTWIDQDVFFFLLDELYGITMR